MGFIGHNIPRVILTVGNFTFLYSLYVGPIIYPFILGLDILLLVQSVMYLGIHTLTVKDQYGHKTCNSCNNC